MRRQRVWAGATLVLLLLAIVGVLAGLPWLIAADDAQRPPQDPQLTTLQLPEGVTLDSLERAEVYEVLDGDTLDIEMEDGRIWTLRYFGVDTPERGERCHREATDRNATLVGETGDTILLLEDERLEDTNGRLLRYVFLEDGTSVEATLVAEGFGEAWRADGRYRDQIVALEEEARQADRGCLW